MKRRTISDVDIEIEELELEVLDIKKTIHEDEPDWREAHRRKTGDIGPGYIPLAERRKKVQLLESKIARLQKEHNALSAKQSASTGKAFGHGELKQKVQDLAKRDGFKAGSTVPSKTILKWVKEIEKEGYKTTEGAIRAVLSGIGITKERGKK